jgi:hypothetical protein
MDIWFYNLILLILKVRLHITNVLVVGGCSLLSVALSLRIRRDKLH